jgi:hypothetical protein
MNLSSPYKAVQSHVLVGILLGMASIAIAIGGCGGSESPAESEGSRNQQVQHTTQDQPVRPTAPPPQKSASAKRSQPGSNAKGSGTNLTVSAAPVANRAEVFYTIEHKVDAVPVGLRILAQRPGKYQTPILSFALLTRADSQRGKTMISLPPGRGRVKITVIPYDRHARPLPGASTSFVSGQTRSAFLLEKRERLGK